MKIEYEHILKVLDIHCSQFTEDFMVFIAKQQPVYKDQILEEHLFAVEDFREDNKPLPERVEQELTEVDSLMKLHDCSYFRIIST